MLDAWHLPGSLLQHWGTLFSSCLEHWPLMALCWVAPQELPSVKQSHLAQWLTPGRKKTHKSPASFPADRTVLKGLASSRAPAESAVSFGSVLFLTSPMLTDTEGAHQEAYGIQISAPKTTISTEKKAMWQDYWLPHLRLWIQHLDLLVI